MLTYADTTFLVLFSLFPPLSSPGEAAQEVGDKVGDKRRFGDACDTGWGEAAEEGPHGEGGGEGGEKLKDKRQKETKHKREEFQDKGKGEAVEKRKRPLSEGAGTARKTQDADDRTSGSAIAGVC